MKNFEQEFTLPPFPAFPSVSRYVPIGPVEDAISRVSRSVFAREAISLIIGPPGTGKSLACAMLAKEFADTHDVIVIGETSILDENSFYRFVLHRLGAAIDGTTRDELELMIHERLCGAESKEHGAVLIFDEAASLSTEVLEAIRRLTNLMRDGKPMVSAIVAGGVKLDETLTAPSLESFVQRVSARCYLYPLNMSETREYIRRSIEACEASPEETISDEAMSTIFNATAGVPRLINQITTEAIDCAAESEQTLIDEGTVDRAWANLQQLPSPMVEQPSLETEGSVVEFGELTDPLPQMRDVNPVEEFQSGLAAESSDVEERVSDEDLPLTMADAIESSSAGDILFDEASACQSVECEAMVQEAAHDEQKPAVTEPPTDPVKLFGEFDNEEKIVVGATSKKPHRSEPAELELESMLHSQIIGLSQFASENTAARYVETDYLASPQEAESNAANEEPVPEAVENMDGAQGTSEESPSVIWYDEPSGSSEGEQGDATGSEGNDDSDLLWITEDIDVERRSEHGASRMTPIRLDQADSSDAPKLKVDYREMLEKMRNHA